MEKLRTTFQLFCFIILLWVVKPTLIYAGTICYEDPYPQSHRTHKPQHAHKPKHQAHHRHKYHETLYGYPCDVCYEDCYENAFESRHPVPCEIPCDPPYTTDYESHWGQNFAQDIRRDFTQYFQEDNLILFGDLLIGAGILANTGLDRAFSQHWQNDFRSSGSNSFFEVPRGCGGLGYYYAPLYLISMGIGHLRERSEFGNVLYNWGYRSIRTFILGGLQQVFLTNALGGGRPNLYQDSKWQPFVYSTGVSGHALYGAIPFITAAMMTEPFIPKAALYVISTLPGLSRVNSNKHYLSQVILGWGLAFLSARSVYQSDHLRTPPYQISVYPKSNGTMLSVCLPF